MTGTPSDPNATAADGTSADSLTQPCGTALKSMHIDIGWTFSSGAPNGRYKLTVGGQDFEGDLASGQIRIDRRLPCDTGNGRLEITVTNGPKFEAEVRLDLPPIHTPQGLLRRLTNLGFYAGVDGVFDGRAQWAVRAFKRAKMNEYERGKREPENNTATQAFLSALQGAYGAHPGDQVGADVALGAATASSVPCGMFGTRVCRRGSFQTAGAADDRDPNPPGDGGRWEGESTAGVSEKIAGIYPLHLRAFDSSAGEAEITNRVKLPQPIHMTQFVLFELGFWIVHGDGGWTAEGTTETRKTYRPDGGFGRMTQWALREFQCHAKMPKAAKEDVESREARYLPRLFAQAAVALTGAARYPDDGRISGALNEATRDALQNWADGALRCPVIVYASGDTAGGGVDMASLKKENIWLYNDHPDEAPRMFAIDFSENYTLPATYGGTVSSGGFTFPRPIVVGTYDDAMEGGPFAKPAGHTWAGQDVEVIPQKTLGRGSNTGEGLSTAELSTFKVVRTAAHFENFAYFDCLNAYDDVTISFGPCHWTLAYCMGDGEPDGRREMPAFFAYFRSAYAEDYQTYFGKFGFFPERTWPLTMSDQTGNYSDRIQMQTEGDNVVLCGLSGDKAKRQAENRYAKTWHVFYRFQMACRVSDDTRLAMWDFTRIRIRDILNKTFTVGGASRRVGDYITSEKGVAMLLRWHIYRPGHLFRTEDNYLQPVIASGNAAAAASQAREDALLQSLSAAGGPQTRDHVSEIHGWTNVPQAPLRNYYTLNLTNPTLSSALNSFDFAEP